MKVTKIDLAKEFYGNVSQQLAKKGGPSIPGLDEIPTEVLEAAGGVLGDMTKIISMLAGGGLPDLLKAALAGEAEVPPGRN